MDISFELYKVFYYVATTLSFFRSLKAALYFPVCCKPVCEVPGTKTGASFVSSEYQKGHPDPRGGISSSSCGAGSEPFV